MDHSTYTEFKTEESVNKGLKFRTILYELLEKEFLNRSIHNRHRTQLNVVCIQTYVKKEVPLLLIRIQNTSLGRHFSSSEDRRAYLLPKVSENNLS